MDEKKRELAESRGIKAYSSREELLADSTIEMVTIATPNDVHDFYRNFVRSIDGACE